MLMIYRILCKQGYTFAEGGTALADFVDAAQIAGYAKEAVEKLAKSGLVAGSGGRIHPLDHTTRAEVAVLLARILKLE